ncbi:hypothetical protein DFQ28_002469 [Apophysomyces sp. BC1034]|nr:hypothetical protein DFQ28_002469 [Apophysomyces sp. BC1034]
MSRSDSHAWATHALWGRRLSAPGARRARAPHHARTAPARMLVLGVTTLALFGCAQPWQRFKPGDDESILIARLGAPREVYDLPDGGKRLMWPTQPMGETTTAADVDTAGKVVDVRQALQNSEFYQAEIGKWTKNDVLVHFGKPEETAYFPLMKHEVWSYRYMDDDVWYQLYHFYFDDAGVLRLTQKTPDPLHDPDRRRFLSG